MTGTWKAIGGVVLQAALLTGCAQAGNPPSVYHTAQAKDPQPEQKSGDRDSVRKDRSPEKPEGAEPSADKTRPPGGEEASQTPPNDLPAGAKFEVREAVFDNGMPKQRTEGYVDANGEFVPHGLVTKWYEQTGTLHSKVEWRHGLPHGKVETWYYHGQLWTVGEYYEGREHGKWLRYHQTGGKFSEWTMERGAWHGKYTEWHENGKMRLEVEFVHGQRQGPQKLYDEQGVLFMTSDYVDGVEQP